MVVANSKALATLVSTHIHDTNYLLKHSLFLSFSNVLSLVLDCIIIIIVKSAKINKSESESESESDLDLLSATVLVILLLLYPYCDFLMKCLKHNNM